MFCSHVLNIAHVCLFTMFYIIRLFLKIETTSSGGSDAHVFNSTKYFGEKSLNGIHRDLLLSAKHGGFNLMTQSCGVLVKLLLV